MAPPVPALSPPGSPASDIVRDSGAAGLQRYIDANPNSVRRIQDEMNNVNLLYRDDHQGQPPTTTQSQPPAQPQQRYDNMWAERKALAASMALSSAASSVAQLGMCERVSRHWRRQVPQQRTSGPVLCASEFLKFCGSNQVTEACWVTAIRAVWPTALLPRQGAPTSRIRPSSSPSPCAGTAREYCEVRWPMHLRSQARADTRVTARVTVRVTIGVTTLSG